MRKIFILFTLLVASQLTAQDQLYKVTLLRAKPGELLRLIEVIKEDISNYTDYTSNKPYLLRHSQGDHWDLMLIYPIDDLDSYFSNDKSNKRKGSQSFEKPIGDPFFDIVSYQEEAIVSGPIINKFVEAFEKYKLFHIEIFTSLAGKQAELVKQRQSENKFYALINHRPNFIFNRVFGPSWDNFTIGFYDDMHDFAGPEIAFEEEDKAAKAAGFEGVNFIGSYLRSLIADHHDTLAWKID
ncbi:hypothetical protein [Ekhidna sp. To15]|uniref:hypothetical protein n=1 Tax=Ekhidna sp. To15 TaxID=3395267 RepID=UPI003F51C85D